MQLGRPRRTSTSNRYREARIQGPGERRRPRSPQRARGRPDRHVDHQRDAAAGDDRAAGDPARDGRQPCQGEGVLEAADRERAVVSVRQRRRRDRPAGVHRHTGHGGCNRSRAHVGFRLLSGLPSSPLDNVTDGNKDVTVFPSIGIRSVLRPGIFTTLRTESSQGSQLVACDPSVASGQEFKLFNGGCQPWFGENPFTNGDWWNTATKDVPQLEPLVRDGHDARAVRPELVHQPLALRAAGTGKLGRADGRLDDRRDTELQGDREQQVPELKSAAEAYCGNYDGTPWDPTGANSWLTKGGDLSDPRVISLFIIPYQALKSVSGSKAEIPILGFASFYVMGWTGQKRPRTTPVPTPISRAWRTAPPTRAPCRASSSRASNTSPARSTRTRSAPRTC